jgi:uncharacterized membrane protein
LVSIATLSHSLLNIKSTRDKSRGSKIMILWVAVIGLAIWAYQLVQRLSRLEDKLAKLERGFDQRFAAPEADVAIDVAQVPNDTLIKEPQNTQKQPAPQKPTPVMAEQRFVPAKIVKAADVEQEADSFKPAVILKESLPKDSDQTPSNNPAQTAPLVQEPVKTSPLKRSASINFEELFGKKLPIWAGGITLAVAGFLIVIYAIEMGFFGKIFTPIVQVISAILFGGGLIASAEWAHKAKDKVDDPRISQALSGAGIATLYGAFLAAGNGYDLISPLIAFAGMAAVTAGALFLSTRHGMPSALLGLAGGLAAPALVGGVSMNAPLLAVYLSLTIAGLSGVSRKQRWPWLAIAALVTGAGWSLWMVLVSDAMNWLGTLSIGGFVILLAIAIPMFAMDGPRSALLKIISAAVGAVQLAVLVSLGEFSLLNWGMFILLAAAGQWIAWRDKALDLVPTISLGLSILLLLMWPSPDPIQLLGVSVILAAIHALPLLWRIWGEDTPVQKAIELAGLALAAPAVATWQFMDAVDHDVILSAVATCALAIPAFALFKGWTSEARKTDNRYVLLTASAALLAFLAVASIPPIWVGAIVMAGVALGTLFFGIKAQDDKIGRLAAILGVATLAPLFASLSFYTTEVTSLFEGAGYPIAWPSIARWLALAVMAGVFAWQRTHRIERIGFQAASAMFAYGVCALVIPSSLLPLAPIAGGVVLAFISQRRLAWPRLMPALCVMLGLSAAWAAEPLTDWAMQAAATLIGFNQDFTPWADGVWIIVTRLIAPAAAIGIALYLLRDNLRREIQLSVGAVAAVLGSIAVHTLYRMGFAAVVGDDFVAAGIMQRIIWSSLFIGAGVFMARATTQQLKTMLAPALVFAGVLHHSYFSLLLHNPIWVEQAVGPWPVINWIAPLFILLPAALYALKPMLPENRLPLDRIVDGVVMASIALFTWATLRQAFHGTLLIEDGVYPPENILRSLIGIGLGVGFLLWGIKSEKRDWRLASLAFMVVATLKVFLLDASNLQGLLRIGSFIALGFSLIGIGWLYTRQLKRDDLKHDESVAVPQL